MNFQYSRTKCIGGIAGIVLFYCAFLLLLDITLEHGPRSGYYVHVVFVGGQCLYFIYRNIRALRDKSPVVQIDETGIYDKRSKRGRIAWQDIDSINWTSVSWMQYLKLDISRGPSLRVCFRGLDHSIDFAARYIQELHPEKIQRRGSLSAILFALFCEGYCLFWYVYLITEKTLSYYEPAVVFFIVTLWYPVFLAVRVVFWGLGKIRTDQAMK